MTLAEQHKLKRMTTPKTAVKLTAMEREYLLALLDYRKTTYEASETDDGLELIYIENLQKVIKGEQL